MKAPSRSVAWEQTLPMATLLLISLIAAGPLWGPGLLNTRGGGDSPFLLLRTHQLAANLRAGVFPVRWMPDAAYGLGYPFFSYYAALPYYLAAGFTLVGLDILTAIKLTQTLFFAMAAVGMYCWAKQVLRSRPSAWLAGVAYSVAPFHLVNVYVRGDSLSEFAAFAFYPFILWGLDRLASRPSARKLAIPALAYAGLILTHNVSALIFSPFVLLYTVVCVLRFLGRGQTLARERALIRALWLISSLLLGLLLSAWFWLPALAETGYVQLDAQTTGYFFYGNHFRGLDLVQWRPRFDYTVGADHPSPFAMGAAQAVLALGGACVAMIGLVSRRTRAEAGGPGASLNALLTGPSDGMQPLGAGFGVLGLLLSTWLITPLSRPLWERLPLLRMVQFPWRFLSVQALFAALLGGVLMGPFDGAIRLGSLRAKSRLFGERWRRLRVWAVASALGALLAVTALVDLRPQYLLIRADEVTSERLQLYELFTGNVGSTIRHEYLPRSVKPRPYIGPSQVRPDAPPRAMPVSGELLSAARMKRRPTHRVWQVEAGPSGSEVAFPLFYWPGWRATVDGSPAEVGPAPGSGYLAVRVPTGAHTVEMWLSRTPLRLGAELASLATALTALALWIRAERRQALLRGGLIDGEAPNQGRGSALRLQYVASYSLPFVAVLALVVVLQPRVTVDASRDLTMDFDEMPYLHHNPDRVRFDDWRMVGYSYSADEVAPGEILRVTLDWISNEDPLAESVLDGSRTLRLVPPAAVREDAIPAVAEATAEFIGEEASKAGRRTLELPVPPDAAPGLHLIQITGCPRTYLRPVYIGSGEISEDRPTRATFADGKVHLHSVDAVQLSPGQLDVRLGWSASEGIAANYGLNLSLEDTAGNEWLQQGDGRGGDSRPGYDTQPGRGFLPTSLWPVDRVVADRHFPALQPGIPPGDQYTLTVGLYRVATWETVGIHTVKVSLKETSMRPDSPILARLGEEIALTRIETVSGVQQGERLLVTAYWLSVREPLRDYEVEWRLEMAEQEIVAYAGTQPLAPGSSPMDWPVGAWVAGRATLPIPPTTPAGDYTLSLRLRDPASGAVLGTYRHPGAIAVQGRERLWELPPVEHQVGARFGDMIELAGYDLVQDAESLQLTLYWRALSTPDQHYMYFVHLADPDTGEPMVQVDTMPWGFTYPTGMWVPGEVVSDEVSLRVGDAASGQYDLAVGWYDADTGLRLRAVDDQGRPLLDDRLLLPSDVTVP